MPRHYTDHEGLGSAGNNSFSFFDYVKENPDKIRKGLDSLAGSIGYNPSDLGISESRSSLENGLSSGLSGLSTGLALSGSSVGLFAAAAPYAGIAIAATKFIVGRRKRKKAREAERRRRLEAVRRAREQYFAQLEQKKDVLGEQRKDITKFKETGQVEKQISGIRQNVKQALASTGASFGGASLQEQAVASSELDSLDALLDQSTDRLTGQISELAGIESDIQAEISAERGEFEVTTDRLKGIRERLRAYDETY